MMTVRPRLVTALAALAAVAANCAGDTLPARHSVAPHIGGLVLDNEIAQPFVVVEQRAIGAPSGPDCPAGSLCLYAGRNFAYPRAQLGSCGMTLLAPWGWQRRTEAVDDELAINPRSSASKEAQAGAVALVQHVGSGTSSNDYTILLTIDHERRIVPDIGSARDATDYVYRYCA